MKKDLKSYSSSYRKAAYLCILHQVPVEETSSVIEGVVEDISGIKLESKANATTVAQFAYEVDVLNDIQVCEAVLANENLTIGLVPHHYLQSTPMRCTSCFLETHRGVLNCRYIL